MATVTLFDEVIATFFAAVRADPEVPSGIADAMEALVSKAVAPSTDELLILLSKDPDKEAESGLF